jgi:hypothetical protein
MRGKMSPENSVVIERVVSTQVCSLSAGCQETYDADLLCLPLSIVHCIQRFVRDFGLGSCKIPGQKPLATTYLVTKRQFVLAL